MNLLNSNQPQPTTRCRRSLLPFLGTALSWLMGTATTKDICSIRTRIYQIIATQFSQCDTLVHIVSILNVTRYATPVNRHSINSLIDAIHSTAQDINNLFNVTSSLVFANLWNTMKYLCTISTHTMDYIDAATSGKLSPHVLPVADLQQMLKHITTTLPPTLHLPISPMDTMHFYRYLGTHVLIENKHFLLLIDIPIQDRAQQITIHQVLALNIPHGNYSACYDINTQYFGVTSDATIGLELSSSQFEICKQANGQFCHISMPFQPLANPPTCIAALYAKNKANIESKCSLQLNKASTTPLPTQITPDVWILATPYFSPYSHHKSHIPRKAYGDYPHSTTTTCTKATNGLQCHFGKFLPASKVWNTHLKCKCFLGSGKHMCYQHHCPTFLCLATYGKQSQWFGPPTSCHPTIHTSMPDIWTSSEQFSMPNTIQHETIRWFRHFLESIQPPWNIRFSFRISSTTWSCIILLLLFLVSTCHISTPTFTIR